MKPVNFVARMRDQLVRLGLTPGVGLEEVALAMEQYVDAVLLAKSREQPAVPPPEPAKPMAPVRTAASRVRPAMATEIAVVPPVPEPVVAIPSAPQTWQEFFGFTAEQLVNKKMLVEAFKARPMSDERRIYYRIALTQIS